MIFYDRRALTIIFEREPDKLAITTFAEFMIIAINIGSVTDNAEQYDSLLQKIFLHIAATHSDHQFIFICDNADGAKRFMGENVTTIISPRSRNPLLLKYWYDIRLPSLLKKVNADVYLSSNGICSLAATIPQCIFIHDVNPYGTAAVNKLQLYLYKKYTPKFIAKAGTIITFSAVVKKDILARYQTDSSKVRVVPPFATNQFFPASEKEKLQTKEALAEDKEYFLYRGGDKLALILLKAFSIFKKKQLSSWKLVLVQKKKSKALLNSLANYKYRYDVIVMTDEMVSWQELVRSAYAVFCISSGFQRITMALEVMKSKVPVIAARDSKEEEITGDAALYVDAHDHTDIAERLMQLYKDEQLRSELIRKGGGIAENHNLENSANAIWQCVCESGSNSFTHR